MAATPPPRPMQVLEAARKAQTELEELAEQEQLYQLFPGVLITPSMRLTAARAAGAVAEAAVTVDFDNQLSARRRGRSYLQ